MSEWWTYSLSDFLLFSPRTYYRLFELYNRAIWPAQIATLILGVVVLALLLYRATWGTRAISSILAACWVLVAWAYLLSRYQTINWTAGYFAVGFFMEAVLLIWFGAIRGRLVLRTAGADWPSRAGLPLLLFALFGQPLIAPLLHRPWTQAEVFGIAPDPTVVATLAVLLTTVGRTSWVLLVIPLLWCAISGATLWTMNSPEAWMMPLVASLVVFLAVWKTALRSTRTGQTRG